VGNDGGVHKKGKEASANTKGVSQNFQTEGNGVIYEKELEGKKGHPGRLVSVKMDTGLPSCRSEGEEKKSGGVSCSPPGITRSGGHLYRTKNKNR